MAGWQTGHAEDPTCRHGPEKPVDSTLHRALEPVWVTQVPVLWVNHISEPQATFMDTREQSSHS